MPNSMIERLDTDEAPYILLSGRFITGTLVWYHHICPREVWLMGREVTPDEDDVLLDLGRAVHKTRYPRAKKRG